MKIKQIVIKNFRCFKDEQVIDFDMDGKITLIYGLSGSGKSHLLKFITWVLYDVFVRDKNDDQPLYNKHCFINSDTYDTSVYGKISFIHNNIEYVLEREYKYEKRIVSVVELSRECHLLYKKDNGSWDEYTDNVSKKINEIVPYALSKYFFFHGEADFDYDSRENSELKNAVYSMFGLDAYEKADKHIGSKRQAQTAIYKYSKMLNVGDSNLNELVNDYFKKMVACNSEYERLCKEIIKKQSKISEYDSAIEKLTKSIGEALNSNMYEQKLKSNATLIEFHEKEILVIKKEIGVLLYSSVPYRILLDKVLYTRNLLAESAKQEKSFAGLRKELLNDILLKNDECICGRKLDDDSKKHIIKLIDSMPPNSYTFTFNQFIDEAKKYTDQYNDVYERINDLITKIASIKTKIFDLEQDNKQIIRKLKQFEQTKELASKLETYKTKRDNLLIEKGIYEKESIKYKKQADKYEQLYDDTKSKEKINSNIEYRIEILNKVKSQIESIFNQKSVETIETLENSIREVYEKISTRTDMDDNYAKIKRFLDSDFRLRNEYKSGGQSVIDVYSYVIGMISAMKKLNDVNDEKEFPVLIDAPFSKTDHLQLSHVINVLPTVVPQSVLLTFDIDRIRLHADMSKIGCKWEIISNDDQTISKIERRGEI